MTVRKCMSVLGKRLRLAPLDLPFTHYVALEVSSSCPFFTCQERSQLLLRDVVQEHIWSSVFFHYLLACILTHIFVTLLYGMRRITTFSDKRNPASMGECSWDQGTLPPRGFYVYLRLSRTHIIRSLELKIILGPTTAGHRTCGPVCLPEKSLLLWNAILLNFRSLLVCGEPWLEGQQYFVQLQPVGPQKSDQYSLSP